MAGIALSDIVRFISVLLAVGSTVFSLDPEVLRPHPGEDVTLRCQVDRGVSIRAVEWTRRDMKPKSVIYFSDGHSDPTNQHPSFKDRVELVDRELKNGNVSLILRNVSINDSGTYECRVAVGGKSRRKKRGDIDADPITRIKLKVTNSSSKNEETNLNDGSQINTNPTDGTHNHVGLTVALVLVCSAVVGVRKYKQHKDKQSEQPAADEAGGDQLI